MFNIIHLMFRNGCYRIEFLFKEFNQNVVNFPSLFYQLTIKIFVKKFVNFIHIEICIFLINFTAMVAISFE